MLQSNTEYVVGRGAKFDESHLASQTMYMREALNMTSQELYEEALSVFSKHDVEFDTMIGTGMSGALVIPRLAEKFDCHWAVIRKDGVDSHATKRVEGRVGKQWLLVDDLICSGRTAQRVVDCVQRFSEENDFWTEFVGAYLYGDSPELMSAEQLDEEENVRERAMKSNVRSISKRTL